MDIYRIFSILLMLFSSYNSIHAQGINLTSAPYNKACDNCQSFSIHIEDVDGVCIYRFDLNIEEDSSSINILKIINKLMELNESRVNDSRKRVDSENKIGYVQILKHTPTIQTISMFCCNVKLHSIKGVNIKDLLNIDGIYGRQEKIEFLQVYNEIRMLVCDVVD